MPDLNNPMRGITAAFASGLLTATGPETLVDTTVAIPFAINGVLYSKAATADIATPTTDHRTSAAFVALAADESCVFVYCLNSSGALKVVQGTVTDVDGDTDVVESAYPAFPSIPDDVCPFAYQRVQTAGTSSAWTFGTSNWNATGITKVIRNVSTLPRRPASTALA